MASFFDVIESTTRIYSAVLTDENGARLPSAALTTLTLTLYNKHDQAIINSRSAVNVLNANGGALDAQGNFSFEFTPADMAIITDTLAYENRVALFEFVHGSLAARKSAHEVEIKVKNSVNVP